MFFSLLALIATFALVITAQDPYSSARDSNGNSLPSYSPARPPAVPLAVRSPYTNAWSSTAHNGTLNTNGAMHWPGLPLGWEGIVTVDGISYEYLGTGSQSLPSIPNLKEAKPLTVSYDSQYSNFTFAAGPVRLTASFLSPVLPKDLCRTSVPLSYLTTSVQSIDDASHSVQFYSDVNAAWATFETNVTMHWSLYRGSNIINGSGNATTEADSIYSWFVHLDQPYEFGEEYDVPLWGNFTYSTSSMQASRFSFQSGFSTNLRYSYIMSRYLQNIVDSDYRPSASREPAFAYAHDFGIVSSALVRYTIGSVQEPVIRYLTSSGILPLQPWWSRCYSDVFSMIAYHFDDFAMSQILASQWEAQLKADVDAYYNANIAMVYDNSSTMYSNASRGSILGTDQYGEQYIFDPDTAYGFLDPNNFSSIAVPDLQEAEAYYSIVSLSARQIMAAYVLAVTPIGGDSNSNSSSFEPLMFQKEISSDGNVNTVDVMFPAMPFFLYANPELLKYNMDPLYQNQEGNFYPNGYSMHDLGTHYPNATGHVEGDDEYMPVEESGNMIIMTYAYYKFSGNSAYLEQHYNQLMRWATYLIQYSLMPGVQLSTDDFAGSLANQTNLAIKGIVGLQAMSEISSVIGIMTDAQYYSIIASNYYTQWEYFGIDPSRKHTLLSYQSRASWSLLYNIYPDQLLNLGIIPQSLFDMQSLWYPTVSQIFGVPLDSRHSYTKSDWEMWTAATCAPETRRLFVNALAYWLNHTDTDRAFADIYDTAGTGSYPGPPNPIYCIARPVAGGHFSLLALGRAGANNKTGTSLNSSFVDNSSGSISESGGSTDFGPLPVSVASRMGNSSFVSTTLRTSTSASAVGGVPQGIARISSVNAGNRMATPTLILAT